jgi:catechol 2,3-dioxygenase-like lactoylglutathione lyase family enzyme
MNPSHSLIKPYSIMFFVKDLEKSKQLYAEKLGLTLVSEDPSFPMVSFTFPQSNTLLIIHSNADHAQPEFNFLVEDATKFAEELRQQGAELLTDPYAVTTGTGAVIGDFDNNRIAVVDMTGTSAEEGKLPPKDEPKPLATE